ncbi:ATP-dependent Clp protease adapter ClpS [Psychromonas antarctica]|jgi:ATP-dependent Clp protease adaptor protein ClpS|uniref:ATP-dependent Clp protease adapter ClpS n=1 Tax=Psychromonas antarctica TaxID=67573 RepID=UPI001EE7C8AD|nr:ATP-dependent Clp protease adapter ClpS [Psychromonas antarctica]MCG6199890.1 ATP-dependent Clp protease adapter ClpS [Psychromonas antarctica]
MSDKTSSQTGNESATIARSITKLVPPSMYNVLLHNDNYTPMDFVIEVLQRFFRLDNERATEVMLNVHYKGIGVCGTFTAEIAETKVAQVMAYAQQSEHPLRCSMEKES